MSTCLRTIRANASWSLDRTNACTSAISVGSACVVAAVIGAVCTSPGTRGQSAWHGFSTRVRTRVENPCHEMKSMREIWRFGVTTGGRRSRTQPLPPIKTMRRAFAAKDSRFDGVFYVAVKTTGVFCRPVCRAKPPRTENVEFYSTAQDAMYHGYRACKLCRPLDAGRRPPEVVERLMSCVERSPAQRLRGSDLAKLGIDPSTARRQFRSYCGMTFAAYQRARRMGLALARVRNGSPVIHAQLDAGFGSSSGFRDAFNRLFGTSASTSGGVAILTCCWITTPLGA